MLFLPILAGALWGSVGIYVRKLYSYNMDDYTVLSSRVLVAAVLLFFVILIYNKSLLKIKLKDLWVFIASGLFGMMGVTYFYNKAVGYLTLSFVAVLISLSPIFVVILGAILFREKVTVRKISCMFLAIFGCVLTSGILENTAGMKWSPFGITMGIFGAMFYALYSVFSKIATEKGYHVFTITFYSVLISAIIILPLTNWTSLADFVTEAPIENAIFMILHAVSSSILPYVLYNIALIYVEAGKVSILAAGGEPIAAMIFGVIFFLEIPTVLSMLGVAVTITALYLLCRPEKKNIKVIK
ncbi:MAG: DMT family transporter [Muricomes sp.]